MTPRWKYLLSGAALLILTCAGVVGLWLHRAIQSDLEWTTVIDLKGIASVCGQFAGENGGYPVQEKLGTLDGIRGDLVPKYQEYGLPTGRWKSLIGPFGQRDRFGKREAGGVLDSIQS